jgi:cell division protein FtsI (penicillin-binding protein 3)/stage V sporulation protein D (sporulation-specific penicillin-binding protein)
MARPKTRALLATTALAGIFTVFSWRLVDLQVSKHDHYTALAVRKNVQRQPIFAQRGVIFSAEGEPLAQNDPVKRVLADASLIKDAAQVADIVAPLVELPRGEVLEKLGRKTFSDLHGKEVPARYILLKRAVPEALTWKISEALRAADQRGIFFEQDFRRIYPNGRMLSHVIGFTNSENRGVAGIEQSLDDYLHGHDGHRYFEHDRKGRELVLYRGQERAARHGKSIRLTIDMGLQKIVESELDAAMKEFEPQFAVAVMQRPQTGEILAMATCPGFDPNTVPSQGQSPDDAKSPLINRAIAASYEPGSIFKIVPVGASLTEGLTQPETPIFCENGYFARYKLRDHKPMGTLTVSDLLVKSSNVGVCKLALQLGEPRFYEYVRKFGFGAKTGIVLPGEQAGLLEPPHRWTKLYTISRMPMGHEIAVTPIQAVGAMSVIANGGQLLLPQIVKEILDNEGNLIETVQPQPVRTVLSKAAAAAVRDALVEVTSPRGTARQAAVKGFEVAGKTGTAQVYTHGAVDRSKHRVSFVGFMPAEEPAFTLLVMLEQPKMKSGVASGGLVAAPIFAKIAERAAQYLGLEPEVEVLPGVPVPQRNKVVHR